MAVTTQAAKGLRSGATVRRPASYYVGMTLRYLVLALIGLVLFTPFILAALGTFKTDAEIIAYPPKLLPAEWLVGNWARVWNTDIGSGGTFPRWLFNTAFLAVTTAILTVIFCSMAAYAFARMEFPGREAVFTFMMATLMIPAAVKLIPGYVLMTKLHLINTFSAVLLPAAVTQASIFLLTQFFKAIPKDLEEAALMDGASHFQIYSQVIVPLARPALLTVLILEFQGMWNKFLEPLLYLNTADKYVLNVALSIFQQQFKAQWNLTLVGAMFNAIPVMVLFFIFSRYYIEGVAYTGIKG
jgi:ABC-type glycerol-3-phosphate transport system permease component